MILRTSILSLLAAAAVSAADTPTQRVGQPLVIPEVYIPGADVRAVPRRDRKPPLVVRIMEMKPAKDGKRYNFEVQGLEPGTYDLADFLESADESVKVEIPAIPLEITTALPEGIAFPHAAERSKLPALGGYRTTMILLGLGWLAGLVGLILWKKKKPLTAGDGGPSGPSLAERLRPLVDRASKGNLPPDERARLERLVIGHWRQQLPEIAELSPAEAMVRLRTDPRAAPLVLALERWLHAPGATASNAEIENLLSPYA